MYRNIKELLHINYYQVLEKVLHLEILGYKSLWV